ncbi:MAG TPA: PEGA domain-containing protein [Nitrospirota bacterium]|jgi:hypothetical protein
MRRLTALILCVTFLAGCATSTVIKSNPPGAKAYVDKIYIGQTPVSYSDAGPFWSKPQLDLKKEGFSDFSAELVKNQARVGPIIGAVLVLVPIFWVTGFPDEVQYDMSPAK